MRLRRGAAAALAAALLAPAAAPASEPAGPAPRAQRIQVGEGRALEAASERWFTNVEVVDQHGRPHRFWRDLVRGHVVLVNFAYTSCTTACSPVTANLVKVRKLLGARMGKDVRMITITVDPANDSPAKLAAFAAKLGADAPGWYFVTGSPENVRALLAKLGGAVAKPSEHSMALLVGDAATGNWLRTISMNRPENIAWLVEHIDDPT